MRQAQCSPDRINGCQLAAVPRLAPQHPPALGCGRVLLFPAFQHLACPRMPTPAPDAAIHFQEYLVVRPCEVHAPLTDRMKFELSNRRRNPSLSQSGQKDTVLDWCHCWNASISSRVRPVTSKTSAHFAKVFRMASAVFIAGLISTGSGAGGLGATGSAISRCRLGPDAIRVSGLSRVIAFKLIVSPALHPQDLERPEWRFAALHNLMVPQTHCTCQWLLPPMGIGPTPVVT